MPPTSDDQKVSGPVMCNITVQNSTDTVQIQYSTVVLTSDVEDVAVLPGLVRVLRVGRPAGQVQSGVLPAGAVPVNSTVQDSKVQLRTVHCIVQYCWGSAYN